MEKTRAFLCRLGLPERDAHELPTSAKRFPDGAQYRVEIPSTEGPRCLEAVIDAAAQPPVPRHPHSPGSGGFPHTDQEPHEMAPPPARAGAPGEPSACPTPRPG